MSAAVANPGSVDNMPQQQPGNGGGLPPTPSRAHTSLSTPPIRDSPNMTTPGMSRDKDQETVMGKYFGVSVEQMKRTQALLRLGVTEEDLRVAERLFAVLPGNEELVSKEERLLGLTRSEISFYKALEVLGVDMSLVEDERARRLGSLGIGGRPHTTKAKSTPSIDEASAGMSCFFPRHGHHHTNSTEASARAAPSTQALAVDAMLEAAAEGARMRSLQALCAQQEMVIRDQAAQITELKRVIAAGSLPLPPGHSAQQASAEPPAPPSSDLSGTATVQGGQQSESDVTASAGADMETAMP